MIPWALLPLVVDVVSVAASALLLTWVCRLDGRDAEKLIHRQLWHLAIADLLDALVKLPWLVLGVLGLGRTAAINSICYVAAYHNVFLMASVAVEVHIAMATLLTLCHVSSPRSLCLLARSLPCVWPFGLLYGGMIGYVGKAHTTANGTCNDDDGPMYGDFARLGLMAAALVICTAVYVTAWASACRVAGNAVERRAERRAAIFILAAIVSWGPLMVYTILPKSDTFEKTNYYYIQSALMRLNGLLNVIAYIMHSRRFRQQIRWTDDDGDELGARPSRANQSYAVGFLAADDVSVVTRGRARDALEAAEADTRAIEIERGAERLREAFASKLGELGTESPAALAADAAAETAGSSPTSFDVEAE